MTTAHHSPIEATGLLADADNIVAGLPSGVEMAYTVNRDGHNIADPIRDTIIHEMTTRFGHLPIDHVELARDMCEAAMLILINAKTYSYICD